VAGTSSTIGTLSQNTTWIRPLIIANYPGGDSQVAIDYLDITEYDEDAAGRIYQVASNTGNLYRARAFDDGLAALRSVDSSGITAHSSVLDSRAAALNGMFRTAADTADSILDGGARRVTTLTEAVGGGRAFAGLNGSNRLVSGLEGSQNVIGDLYFGPTTPPVVGTVASPSAKTKTLRIPYTSMIFDPFNTFLGATPASGGSWNDTVTVGPVGVFAMRSPSTGNGGSTSLTGAAILAPGVVVTAVRVRLYRALSTDFSGVLIYNVVGETANSLGSLTLVVNGAWTTLSLTTAVTISNNTIQVKWGGATTSAIGSQAGFAWFEVDYNMANLYQTV
jgi:hypothetical protein